MEVRRLSMDYLEFSHSGFTKHFSHVLCQAAGPWQTKGATSVPEKGEGASDVGFPPGRSALLKEHLSRFQKHRSRPILFQGRGWGIAHRRQLCSESMRGTPQDLRTDSTKPQQKPQRTTGAGDGSDF